MSSKYILPECYGDTLLIEVLGYDKPNHQKGINKVVHTIEKKYKNRKAIGIIDDDKRKPRKKLETYKLLKDSSSLKVYKKPEAENYLIFICPALEKWLLKAANEANINIGQYNIEGLESLKEKTKNLHIKQDQDLYRFLKALRRKMPKPVKDLYDTIRKVLGDEKKAPQKP